MKTKDLLTQLAQLEYSLNDFSFEELNLEEASRMKKSFDTFRASLEEKIFQPRSKTPLTKLSIANNTSRSHKSNQASRSEDQSLLVAQVSHEIRTPLNGIIGFTDLLKEDELNKTQLERVNAIQSASYSLIEIINELLEYSKLDAGLEPFEAIDFNLNNVVNDVMYLCQTLINTKEVKLEATIDKNIPEILVGDPSKLSQVLLNLLGNAIKFVASGSIHLNIELKSHRGSEYRLEYTVTDTGIGISKEKLAHIFDTYRQADSTIKSEFGGTGLGLSIVKKIIENQNGNIEVTSELGKGTCFKFLLSYEKGSLKNLINKKTPVPAKDKLQLVKDLRVLVFEDNTLNQKLIDQRLQSWGCKTYVTDNGLYGLNLLETNRIDLILMDLKMPGMDGYEITNRIRNNENSHIRRIPIIALTADFSINDQQKCDNYGINDFVLKPYMPDELLSKMASFKKPIQANLKVVSANNQPKLEVFTDATKINLAIILEDCMGDIETLEELILLYKQNALEFIGVVRMNLKSQNIEKIANAAHKIKSGLAMMQSKSLHRIVVQIQTLCKEETETKALELLFGAFVEEYPKVELAIDEQVKALKQK